MANRRPASSVDGVILWLRRHIATNGLRVGDALPTEVEIAAKVGVNRSTVREAITGLKVLGIIESRRRGGMRIVRDPVLLELRDWFAGDLDDGMWQVAMEFRAAIERGIAGVVANRITAAGIARLRRLHGAVDADGPAEQVAAAERGFHSALADASLNDLVRLMSTLLAALFQDKTVPPQADPAVWRREHAPLIEALERRDAATFVRLMAAHTEPYLGVRPAARRRKD
ncbi:MAG TPA: FCD domain-containing protein [Planctomycetota bacterium]|nr:FCD domain-containing protein [Planctomycetota bacterium]